MKQWLPKPIMLGFSALVVGGLCTAYLEAKPPKKRPGPRPHAEFMTVRGTVKEITTAPKGEVDGLLLDDGERVHWPPHLQDRFQDVAARGDRIRATGYWEIGRRGDARLEVSTLTNLDTDKTVENPDRPSFSRIGRRSRLTPTAGEISTVRGTVKELTAARRGEIDGLILNDGTWVHWPPHLQARFQSLAGKGDRIRATGCWETGPKGDTKLEVSTLTNLDVGRSVENSDRPPADFVRPTSGARDAVEDRLTALENQLDRLRREIERLRRER